MKTIERITAGEAWIAVFGDVHGAWDAMYAYCGYCAAASRPHEAIPVGLVLQCGDIGLFTSRSALDKATRRFAARDASELGAEGSRTAFGLRPQRPSLRRRPVGRAACSRRF